MAYSLDTSLREAKLKDVIWVQEIEKLCSHTEFCREKQRRLMKESLSPLGRHAAAHLKFSINIRSARESTCLG
jgi:hypothetical protein